ncbi:MAG: HD-GYP domain-containing protein, partial [Aureliella sp.]
MPVPQSSGSIPYVPSELTEDLAHLAARLEAPVAHLDRPTQEVVAELISAAGLADFLSECPIPVDACCRAVQEIQYDGRAIAVPIGQQHSAVFCGLTTEAYQAKVAAIVRAGVSIAKTVMEAACEATRLTRHNHLLQLQLDASAVQIAQSFEEQCWLRDLARNLSISGATANANSLARGILGPLLDLLRAEALFVIVDKEETSRSGLASAGFGNCSWPTDTIAKVLEELAPNGPSCPIVINNSNLHNGEIHSLVAVPIITGERPLGFITAVNRLVDQAGAFGLIDPEFGSVEVGLMEEASVLLSTQAHNIRLVLDSQHLALGTLQAMSRAIDARDPYTRGHSERVARLSFEIAEILGLQETACQEIYVAGVLHDVGKIGIPDRVLLKAGSLSDEEFGIIKQHPEIGYRIIEQLGKLHFTLPGVLYHH